MSEIKLGIIGAGNIAHEHLKVLKGIDDVRVVGITSRTNSKAENLAKIYSIERVFDDSSQLFQQYSLDGLLILVSADQIFEVSKNIIPKNIPVFIEKPPGLIPEQTKILAEIARKHRTKSFVGFNRRYYSVFHKGLQIIKDHGELLGIAVEGHERFWKIESGEVPKNIRENWIYANSTHTIDLLRFFGGEIKIINTLTRKIKEKNNDQFVSSLEFYSGILGTYTSHWFSPGGWTVKLYGNGVTVKFEPLEKGHWIDKTFDSHEIVIDELDLSFKPGFYRQMKAFISMIKTGKLDWPGIDLFSAHKTMELAKQYTYD